MAYVISFLLSGAGARRNCAKECAMSLAGDEREIRTLTNSECESWLIVVDTVALEIFRLPNSGWSPDGMDGWREREGGKIS